MRDVLSFQRRQTLLLCDMQLIFPNYAQDIVWCLCQDIGPFYRATQRDGGGAESGGFICLSV